MTPLVERFNARKSRSDVLTGLLTDLARITSLRHKLIDCVIDLSSLVRKSDLQLSDIHELSRLYLRSIQKFVSSLRSLPTDHPLTGELPLWQELIDVITDACEPQKLTLLPLSIQPFIASIQRTDIVLSTAAGRSATVPALDSEAAVRERLSILIEPRIDSILEALERIDQYLITAGLANTDYVNYSQLSEACEKDFNLIDMEWSYLSSIASFWKAAIPNTYHELLTQINEVVNCYWSMHVSGSTKTSQLSLNTYYTLVRQKLLELIDNRNIDAQVS